MGGVEGAHVILVSALGPQFGLGLGLGPGLDNWLQGLTLLIARRVLMF